MDAAGRTALKPLATAKELVTEPGKTIGDTFKGVGNIFGGAGGRCRRPTRIKKASSPPSPAAPRRGASSLSISASILIPASRRSHDELTRLATANAIGETSVNVGLAFVTGGVGFAISVSSTSQKLRVALRDKTAAQLEQDGARVPRRDGHRESAQDAFYANAYLTPTDKVIIVVVLMMLGNVDSGREILCGDRDAGNSVEMAFFYRRQAELIAKYNKKLTPVRGFVRAGGRR